MSVEDRLLWWQRWAVIIAVVGGSIAVRISDGDIFGVPKATVILLCAVGALVISGCRVALTGRLSLLTGPPVWSAGALGFAMLVSTVLSTQRGQSLVGQYTQDAGMLQYGAYLVLFWTTLRSFRPDQMRLLARAIVAAAAFVSLYAVYQWLGNDPIDWSRNDQVFSVMGNVDFLGGWCGAVAPVAVMLAVWRNEYLEWRILAGVTSVALAFASYATHSFQGPMSVLAGVGFFALVTVGPHARARLARVSRPLIGAVLLVVVVAGAVAGPRVVTAVRSGVDNGMLERRYFWPAAIETGLDHPFAGTGLDTFHNQFLSRRPAAHAAIPASQNAGAAHSVPLDMFANGGFLVLLAYLAFVGITAWRLLVGLHRHADDRRLLLAGFGAAWFGYQVQSFVSIDKPALAVMHFVLAGAVHVVAGLPPWPEIELRRASTGHPIDQRDITGVSVAIASVVVIVGAVGAWFCTQPLRADIAYASGVKELSTNPEASVREIKHALELNPSEARYTFDLSRAYIVLGDGTSAAAAAVEGARLEPGDSSYHAYAADVLARGGQVDEARALYREALRIDPYGLDILLRAATFEAQTGAKDRALQLVDRALAVSDDRADVWERVAGVYSTLGDEKAATRARERKVALGG